MKVCLIHPNHENSTDCRLDPPLGLLYIASALRQADVEVVIIDLSGRTDYNFPVADFYGTTAYVSTLRETKRIHKACMDINPTAEFIIGGAHATARPDDFPYAVVIEGRGENAMVEVVTGNKSTLTPFSILPAFDLIDRNSYSRKIAGIKSLPLITSRGCPYKCAFCGMAKMHRMDKIVFANEGEIESHLAQIKWLGFDALNIQDDIFTMQSTSVLEQIRGFGFKFRCMGRVGYDVENTYQMLADAGCVQVAWGIESGSQTILDKMNKGVKVQNNRNVIKWAKNAGITSRCFFIIGFPGETRETLEETKRFIEETDPDQVFVSNFIPYPGTDVSLRPHKYGITKMSGHFKDYYQVSKNGTGGVVIDTEWLRREKFKELELEFREWLSKREMKGDKQDYEMTT
jgi:anaerobic magnesium-protoporphyrin IX monomethyl ester cyclase